MPLNRPNSWRALLFSVIRRGGGGRHAGGAVPATAIAAETSDPLQAETGDYLLTE